MKLHIEEANIEELDRNDEEVSAEITFTPKRHWDSPEEYYEIWKSELSISTNCLGNSCVFLAENDIEIEGYFSVVKVENDFWVGNILVKKGFWLEHIFIKPRYIETGIAKKLITYAENYCNRNGINYLHIFADPNVNEFYEKLGAKYLGESSSDVDGRTVSIFEFSYGNK